MAKYVSQPISTLDQYQGYDTDFAMYCSLFIYWSWSFYRYILLYSWMRLWQVRHLFILYIITSTHWVHMCTCPQGNTAVFLCLSRTTTQELSSVLSVLSFFVFELSKSRSVSDSVSDSESLSISTRFSWSFCLHVGSLLYESVFKLLLLLSISFESILCRKWINNLKIIHSQKAKLIHVSIASTITNWNTPWKKLLYHSTHNKKGASSLSSNFTIFQTKK